MHSRKPSKPFLAAYNSECFLGDMIFEGDEIVMIDGVAYHATCAEEDGYILGAEGKDDFFG